MNENTSYIDPEKVAENPGLLPYAHTVGGAVIKPEDIGKTKGRALAAMEQQTDMQLKQLYQQMKTLVDQANEIKQRKEASEKIYSAQMGFEPLINHTYFLYEKEDDTHVVSMIAPHEWGRKKTFKQFLHKIKLLADHTWEIIIK